MSIHRTASASVVDNKINDWAFHLDGVFHNVSQEEIFDSVAKDVVDRTLDGYNGLFYFSPINTKLISSFSNRNNYVLWPNRGWKNSYNDWFC